MRLCTSSPSTRSPAGPVGRFVPALRFVVAERCPPHRHAGHAETSPCKPRTPKQPTGVKARHDPEWRVDVLPHLQEPAPIWAVTPALTALIVIQVPASAAYVTIQVAAPEVARTTGLPVEFVGVFTALSYLGAIAGGALTLSLLRRLGAFRACQVAVIGCALALAATTLATVWALIVGALLLGLAHAPVTPLGSHVLAARTPPAIRGLVFSIKQAAVPLGGVLAGVLVTAVVVASDWQSAVWVMASLCVLTALLVMPLRAHLDDLEDAPKASRTSPWREMCGSIRCVVEHGPILTLVFVGCAFGAAQWCFTAFYVAFVAEDRGLPLVTAGVGFAIGQAAGVAGRIFWGAVADRSGRPIRLLVGLGIAMAGGLTLLTLTDAAWPKAVTLALAALVGVTAIGWNGVLIAEVARRSPSGQVAAVAGGFVAFFAVSTIAFPLAFAAVALLVGYAAGFIAIALLCLYASWRLYRQVPEADDDRADDDCADA
ncbi:MAG: MFS transporter [Geminicoccaceae bacterium]|nr:MAG: MFS transporter [Geminicoccaceae bacterium]